MVDHHGRINGQKVSALGAGTNRAHLEDVIKSNGSTPNRDSQYAAGNSTACHPIGRLRCAKRPISG
jgi:hypothetical protein